MCKSKAEGGTRCVYADQITNVRKKARYKHRGEYDVERQAEKAVRKWKEENKELVREHLPETQPFQVKSSGKKVPAHMMALFSQGSREPIVGLPEEERVAATKKLYEDKKEWEESLTPDEDRVVHNYAINFYELINRYLRRSGLAELFRTDPFYKESDWKTRCKNAVKDMDSALKKAPKPEEPRKVYRFFRVPAGVSPVEYMERYFKKGEGFQDAAYMSTTADSEFLLAHLHSRNKGTRNHGYVIMEILTKDGASLQPREMSSPGNVQSLEKEIILPRNKKFTVVSTRRSQKFGFASNRKDLSNHYYPSYGGGESAYDRWGHFKEGETMSFPVIQMVDESLL